MLPIKNGGIFLLKCLKQPVRRSERPSSVNEVDSFPPRGSLDVRQGFTFLPKKMKFAEFFFRQGEAAKRQTIFALLCAGTMRQGEGLEQGKNLKQTSIGSHTLATFPATVGFFAFSPSGKKRKRGKQGITSKAKIKNTNDTLQSVMKQAKPAQRGKQGCNVFYDCIERLRKTS